MGSQRFCLKWNNQQSNMAAEFEDMLESETFADVTLACEGSSLKAHKVVLAACSPLFRSLLKDSPCSHPIIFMKDMKYHELKAILQFMYKGEVSIAQEQLSSLIKAASTLKVKGLAEVPQNQSQQSFNEHQPQQPFNEHQPQQSFNEQLYDESFDNNNQPPQSSINYNLKKRQLRKKLRDESVQQNIEAYPPKKSKLESTLLGELDGKNGSQLLLKENQMVKPDTKTSSSNSDIALNSNDSLIDNSNTSSEFPSNCTHIDDHSLHHDTSDINTTTPAHDTLELSSPDSFSPTPHLEPVKNEISEISEDMENVDKEPPSTCILNFPNEDLRSRSLDENDTMYDDSMQSNIDTNSPSDLTSTSISSQDLTDPIYCVSNGGSAISKMFTTKNSEIYGEDSIKFSRTCQFCGKRYHPSSLSRHIKAMHMGITYPCQYCNLTFNDKSNMRKHKKYHHP